MSRGPARWVLAVDAESEYQTPEDLQGKRIATELVGFTMRFFADRGIDVQVEFSWGSTEAKVREGVVDAIVDVTETGTTLRANGLKIIYTLLTTNTQLIANKRAYQDPQKREKLDQIHMLLQAALEARKMVGLKMNVPKESVETVVQTTSFSGRTDRCRALQIRLVRDRVCSVRGGSSVTDSEASQGRSQRHHRIRPEQGALVQIKNCLTGNSMQWSSFRRRVTDSDW